MLRGVGVVAVACVALLASVEARADPQIVVRGQDRQSPFMRIYGPTLPPYGFVRFCEEFARECRPGRLEDSRVNATPELLRELDQINRHVNRIIEAATDLEIYGEIERWTIPKTKGDCEDYAILKRHMLIARGWPVSSLLLTVVRDEKGEGHAILTARTAQGDLILDNKADDLKLWSRTRYTYIMRQSYIDPKVWLALDPRDVPSPAPLAGMRSR